MEALPHTPTTDSVAAGPTFEVNTPQIDSLIDRCTVIILGSRRIGINSDERHELALPFIASEIIVGEYEALHSGGSHFNNLPRLAYNPFHRACPLHGGSTSDG